MATRKPLVLGDDGLPQRLQPGDTLQAPTTEASLNTVTNGESATPLTIGMPVYFSAQDTVRRAQANAKSTAQLAGLVFDPTIAAGAVGNIAVSGTLTATTTQWDAVTGLTGGLLFNTNYFLNVSAPGRLTSTPPDGSVAGSCNVYVGRAASPTELEISFELPILL